MKCKFCNKNDVKGAEIIDGELEPICDDCLDSLSDYQEDEDEEQSK